MSWFKDIENWMAKAFNAAPSWQQTASATLTVTAPLLQTIVTLSAGEAAGAEVGSIVSEVQSDMAAAATLIKSSGATPTLTSVLGSIQTNLGGLLTAGHIKDQGTLTKVTSIVNTFVGEIEAIASVIPKAA